MDLPDYVKHEILDNASEDWTPLFDVTSSVRACMPDRTVDEQIEVAKRFISVMLAHGIVKLCYDCLATSTNRNKRIGKDLTKEETRREMKERSNWLTHERRDPDERWVTIALTPTGEAAVHQGKLPSY